MPSTRDTVPLEMLVNALEAERFFRRALLTELIEEMGAQVDCVAAREVAKETLGRLDKGALDDAAFGFAMNALREALRLGTSVTTPVVGQAVSRHDVPESSRVVSSGEVGATTTELAHTA